MKGQQSIPITTLFLDIGGVLLTNVRNVAIIKEKEMIITLCLTTLLGLGNVAWAAEKYSSNQLKADFYADLGPNTIDVSSYPIEQQKNYKVFARVCFQCHTLARAINSPIIPRQDWERYVRRMAIDTEDRAGTRIEPADAERIIDFLAYDSHRRKTEDSAKFKAKTRELRVLFAAVLQERARLEAQANKRDARESTLGEDAQPMPEPRPRE